MSGLGLRIAFYSVGLCLDWIISLSQLRSIRHISRVNRMSGWWIWEQVGLPKLRPENTDGKVRSETWMTGLLKYNTTRNVLF